MEFSGRVTISLLALPINQRIRWVDALIEQDPEIVSEYRSEKDDVLIGIIIDYGRKLQK